MAVSVISSVSKWKEFFTRYMEEECHKLVVDDSKYKRIIVDYSKLQKFDVRLAQETVQNPDMCLGQAEDALQVLDLPVKKTLVARVALSHLPRSLLVRDIQNHHLNTLISIRGMFRNISKVDRRRITEAAFECARCKNVQYIQQEGQGGFVEPSYCNCNEEKKGVFRLVMKESKFEEYQRVRIQELTEDLPGGADPLWIDCNMTDDLTQRIMPGEKVIITGIHRSAQRIQKQRKTSYFDDYLDVVAVERNTRSYEELEPTKEELEKIRAIAYGPNPLSKIVRSIAPAITGMDEVKEGVAHLLFGGVQKPLPDGTYIRGDIHVLLPGDGGTGKSKILGAIPLIAPKSYSTNGQASGAGLTAATVPDDFGEGFRAEAGALVLADNGICTIDEIDKMPVEERKKMYGCLEDQEVLIDRAGIHARMRCKTSLLAAGNPKKGKWNEFDSIIEQINFDAPMISRFDLIYVIVDKPDEKRDRAVSQNIIAAHHAGQLAARDKAKPYSVDKTRLSGLQKTIEPAIPFTLLRKYIALARDCYPELSPEAETILQDYYLKLRKGSGDGDDKALKMTARMMDGLVRLAEAAARMRLSEDLISQKDAEQAVRVHYESLKNSAANPETGEIDIGYLTVGIGKPQRDRMTTLKNTIREMSKTAGKVPVQSLEDKLAVDKYPMPKLEGDLKKLKEIGEVHYPDEGHIAVSE